MKRASKKAAKVVDEVEVIKPRIELVIDDPDLIAAIESKISTPKDQLRGVAVTLSELLPTYIGPGRRHIEAALINVDHAIRYTP